MSLVNPIKYTIYDQVVPRDRLPEIAITSDSMAWGTVEMQLPIDALVSTSAQVWQLADPNLDPDHQDRWSRLQPEMLGLYPNVLDYTSSQLYSGYYRLSWHFNPADMHPMADSSGIPPKYSVEFFINADTSASSDICSPKLIILIEDPISFTGITGVQATTGSVFQGATGIRGLTGLHGHTGIQGWTGAANFINDASYPQPIPPPPMLLWNLTDEGLFASCAGMTGVYVQISAGSLQGATGQTGIGFIDDHKVLAADDDPLPGPLDSKISAGDGISGKIIGDIHSFEQYEIAAKIDGTTIKFRPDGAMVAEETYYVKVDQSGSPDFLANQILAGDGIATSVVALPLSDRHLLEIKTDIDGVTLGYNGSGQLIVLQSGTTGVQGMTGLSLIGGTGIKGVTGVLGIDGGTGIQGVTGLAGDAGGTGIRGETGLAGNGGDIGGTGIQGETGLTGENGGIGGTGIQGVTGMAGVTGLGVDANEIHQPYDEPGVLTTGLYFDNTSTGDTSSQFIRGEYFNDEGIDTNHGQVTIGYDSKFQVVRSSDGAVLMSGGDTTLHLEALVVGPAPSMNPNYRFVTIGNGDNGDIFHYDGTFQLQNYVMSDLHGSHYNNFMLSPDQSPVAPTYPFVDTYDWGVTLYFDGTNVRAVRKDGKRSLLSTSWS